MSQHPTLYLNTTTHLDGCNQSLLTHFQYQPPSSFDIFTGVLMIIIIVTSLAGNILIFYAFVTNPKLQVVNNYFIMNLTLSDILTASLVIPFDANMKLNGLSSWTHGAVMCKVWTTAYTISVPTSILTLCVVSIDRYQAISNPLGYRAGVTLNKTKALFFIGGIWALSLFMAFLPLIAGSPLNVTMSRDLPSDCPDVYFCYFDISASYSAAVTIIAFILPSVVMATLYGRMYVIITYERFISDEITGGIGSYRGEMNKIGRNAGENEQKGNKKEGITTEHAKNRNNKAEINDNKKMRNHKECDTKSGINMAQNGQAKNRTNANATLYDKNTTNKHISGKASRNIAQIDQNEMKNHTLEKECNEKGTGQNLQDANCSYETERNVAKIGQKINENNIEKEFAKHKINQRYQEKNNNNGAKRTNGNNATTSNTIERNKGKNETGCNKHKNSRNNTGSHTNQSHPSSTTTLRTRSHHTRYQTKVARHFSVIVLVQLVCWYPYSVASLVYNLCDSCEHISSSAQYFLLTIGYLSCAINPYLYAYQQRSFRQVFNRMLRLRC